MNSSGRLEFDFSSKCQWEKSMILYDVLLYTTTEIRNFFERKNFVQKKQITFT